MVTFFEAGTFKHKELSVTVDKPCILMVKDINAKSANLHIADPGQTQSPIQVELKIGKKKTSAHSRLQPNRHLCRSYQAIHCKTLISI